MPPNPNNWRGALFGKTRKYKNGTPKYHQGIDLFAPPGLPIYSMYDGTVVKIVMEQPAKIKNKYPDDYHGDTDAAGNRIYIKSEVKGKTIYVAYFHLDLYESKKIGLQVGSTVRAGQVIGAAGTTGNADPDKPHLHLGIQNQSVKWVDPAAYLNAKIDETTGEITINP